MNDNDDEGFIEINKSTMMLDTMKQCQKNLLPHEQIRSITSKFIHNKSCHYPYSTQNPYDDDDDDDNNDGLFFIFLC